MYILMLSVKIQLAEVQLLYIPIRELNQVMIIDHPHYGLNSNRSPIYIRIPDCQPSTTASRCTMEHILSWEMQRM
jgi:hypothetical protein